MLGSAFCSCHVHLPGVNVWNAECEIRLQVFAVVHNLSVKAKRNVQEVLQS